MSHHCHCPIHGDHPCDCCPKCHEVCHEAHGSDAHGDFAHQLLEMADQAWMEVLKEKIKEQIKASSGKRLDELAKIVAEANESRWQHKLASQKEVHDYADKVRSFFGRKS